VQSNRVLSRRATTLIAVAVIAGILLSTAAGAAAGGTVAYLVLRNYPTDAAGPTAMSAAPVVPTALPPAGTAGPAPAEASGESVAQAAASLAPSVVTVVNHLQSSPGLFGQLVQGSEASGSGVVISGQGHVVTNAHVVDGAEKLEVTLSNGTTIPATLVGSDVYSDLAVLKIDAGAAPAAVLGDSDALVPGDTVIAIGSPLGDLTNTVTVGVVSAKDRNLETSSGFQMEGLLQTDAAINSGNSGGPLVSLKGEVVGVNTLIVRSSGTGAVAEGLGFAIPANTARAVAQQIIEKGYFSRPELGIQWQLVTPRVAAVYNLPVQWGVYVTGVVGGSPAEQAGIQRDDILTKIGDIALDESHAYLNALYQHQPGDTVTVSFVRNQQEMQVQVTLGETKR
jgi:serine protease Do